MRKVLSFVLILVLLFSVLPTGLFSITVSASGNTTEFAGGSGVLGDPYLISNATHLSNVNNYLNAHFKLLCDIKAPVQSIGLFTGVFDGNGFAIKNYNTYITFSGSVRGGLFTQNKGTIKNLGMVDCNITIKSNNNETEDYVGSIVGENLGTIYNCYNVGSVFTLEQFVRVSIGGIAGRNHGTIENCYNSSDITVTGLRLIYIGGIVGENESGGIITDCYNTAIISADSSSSSGTAVSYAGGVVGYTDGTVKNCYNTGNVSVSAVSGYYKGAARSYAGGISGDGSRIINCYNTGEISTSADGYAEFSYAGGISGSIIEISDCYNSGVISSGNHIGGLSSDNFAGGIVGIVEKIYGESGGIKNCYNLGSVYGGYAGGIVGYCSNSTVKSSYNNGEISSRYCAGGIAGFSNETEECYNTGEITTSTATSSSGTLYLYSGGIVGNGSKANNCYNTGLVSASFLGQNASRVCLYSGGISGELVTIENCYNLSEVMASSSATSVTVTSKGGIAGKASTITNCYYADYISNGVSWATDNAVKCTIGQLKKETTFVGFDFEDVWVITNVGDYLHPQLLSNHNCFYQKDFDDYNHFDKCAICSFKINIIAHEFDDFCDAYCNDCNKERIPPHCYQWVVDKENNCGVDGIKHEECSECHTKRNENTVIYATGKHSYDNNCDTECNVCYSKRGVIHSFEWIVDKENNCGESGIIHRECSVCHEKRDENMIIEATGNHIYNDNCDAVCDVCEQTRTAPHSYEWIIDKNATCGETGIKHEECSECYIKRNENMIIKATGNHIYNDNCDAVCDVCEQTRIAPHSYEWIIDKNAICGEVGSKHEECSECHTKRNENTEIEATGKHIYEWIIDKENNCGVDGVKHEECYVCHIKQNENTVIKATGNHISDGIRDTECNICNQTISHISFELNNGSGTFNNLVKLSKEAFLLPTAIPTRNGYNFAGWSTTKNGNPEYQAGNSLLANKSMTLYAQWDLHCQNCDGSGYDKIDCKKCDGGQLGYKDKCPSCNDKKYYCSNCGSWGNGSILWQDTCYCGSDDWYWCSLCEGSGGWWTYYDCDDCNGSGFSLGNCKDCTGTGKVIRTTVSAPDVPTVKSTTLNTVILNKIENGEYSLDGINWQESPVFENLKIGGKYNFYQRYAKTDTTFTSDSSQALSFILHSYDNSCDKECNECGAVREIEHDYGNDHICDICGYKDYTPGDIDGVEGVTDADAVYLLYHTFLSDIYPVNQDCDFNDDGEVNDKDAVYLLYYTFLPDLYPIN